MGDLWYPPPPSRRQAANFFATAWPAPLKPAVDGDLHGEALDDVPAVREALRRQADGTHHRLDALHPLGLPLQGGALLGKGEGITVVAQPQRMKEKKMGLVMQVTCMST